VIKLQFHDVDAFIHPAYRGNTELRYVMKTEDTRLSRDHFARLVEEIRTVSCLPMATPFDEASVDLCVEFDMPLIKIASSDMNDWVLIEKIAAPAARSSPPAVAPPRRTSTTWCASSPNAATRANPPSSRP
jgi:N-acetylneuraminate synthase